MCKNNIKSALAFAFLMFWACPQFAVAEEDDGGSQAGERSTPDSSLSATTQNQVGQDPYYVPANFGQLDELNQVIEYQEKAIKAKANTLKLMQLDKQQSDLNMMLLQPAVIPPPALATQEEEKPLEQTAKGPAPLFPMPGGDPLIRSVYGVGDNLEAILQIPGGGQIIVRTGDPLPQGYKVVSITHDAVKIGKAKETTLLAFGAAPARPTQPGTDSSSIQGTTAQ